MKHRLLTLFGFLISLAALQAQNGNFYISGPEVLCENGCATYVLEGQGSTLPADTLITWTATDNAGGNVVSINSSGKFATICFQGTGSFTILAEITMSPTGPVFTATFQVFVSHGPLLAIQSDSPCSEGITTPPGSGQCDKVCANSLIHYYAYDLAGATYPVQWNVSGAESFDVDPSQQSATVQWGAPGTGYVSVFGGFTDLCVGEQSLCVEILENAVASFTTTPQNDGSELRVCEGQTVQFTNTSQNGAHFFWELGPYGTSMETDAEATFETPGTYEIRLIANNSCYCQADTATLTVIVEDAESPLLDCVGTICAGETVTYTSATECGIYHWQISGSYNIVDGGATADNFITIEWLDGPAGTIELTVEDCPNANVCLEPTIRQIPILSDNAEIDGPDRVCLGEVTQYDLIPYEGTEFIWTVSNFGTIVSGQGTNSITVKWFDGFYPSQAQMVTVEYSNCYLGCGGADTLVVNVRPEYYVTGPIEVCADGTYNYQAKNTQNNAAVSGIWQLLALDGTQVWNSGSPTANPAVPFTVPPGYYNLTMTADNPAGYCTDGFELQIEVKTPPVAPASISGEPNICPGNTYSYKAEGAEASSSIRWEVNNGGTVSTIIGNPINVMWGAAPPYSLTAVAVSNNGLGCESAPLTLNVNQLSGFTINGAADVCLDQISAFSTQGYAGIDYVWSISPAGAGTITGDPKKPSVEILWHIAGAATVTVDVCGQSAGFPVTVHALPEPVVNHPTDLCPNATVQLQTTAPFDAYEWLDENGNLLSNAVAPNLGPGYLQVRVTDQYGCLGDTTFYIDPHPASEINISTPDPDVFCGLPPQATLYALNSSAGYNYQWYLDGASVGANNPSFNATAYGAYQVGITDVYGCTFLSNVISIDSCGGGSGGPGPMFDCTGSDFDFGIQPGTACNERSYTNLSTNFTAGSTIWYYSLAGSDFWSQFSTDENPVFTYPEAGFYRVAVTGEYTNPSGDVGRCGAIRVDTVVVAADFEVDNACPGEAVEFFDLSTFLPIASITGWSWNFGDPGSGAANTSSNQDPTHTFAAAGSYTVSLTITSNTGCTSTITRQLEVYPPPPVTFAEPEVNCEGTAIEFNADVPSNVTYAIWNFGDPASGAANQSQLFDTYHQFDAPGNYNIKLDVTSIYGCSNVFSRQLTIAPNLLAGDIALSQPSPICEGDTTTLSAPAGGLTWLWSDSTAVENLAVGQTGVYSVTVTDAEGCTYTPGAVTVDVIESPEAPIRALTLNEYGQPTGYFYDTYSICEGEDVYLETTENTQYSYLWSNGETTTRIEFSELRDNQLSAGSHEIFLTVTDNATGCSQVIGPFVVEVHGLPANVQITASNPGLICEGTETTFSVSSPDPGLTYVWNNNETGPTMTTAQPGIYYATATNAFGCSAESNSLVIVDGPDISKIPSGCHTRCSPDTICFPLLPDVTSYQWYFNDAPVAGPEGQLPQLVATQSGDYYVQMVSTQGCTLNSGTLSLEMQEGFGTIRGNVYFDLNEDGVIDPADSLMANIHIDLSQNGTPVSQTSTDGSGAYVFADIPSGPYTVTLDTLSLDPGVRVYQVSFDTLISGCGMDDIRIDFLCYLDCTSMESHAQDVVLCPGETFVYDGIPYASDTTFTAHFTTAFGCDSSEVITIVVSRPDTTFISIPTCGDTPVDYTGQQLVAGSTTAFHFPNQYGCDSVVVVDIPQLPVQSESLTFDLCQGETMVFDGVTLEPGDTQVFTYTNQAGCDSLVTVSINGLPADATTLELTACSGSSVTYAGATLMPGDQQDFGFTNQNGCDSTVSVSVVELPVYHEMMNFQACTGSTIIFDGVAVAAGANQVFAYTTAEGCDSTITVQVAEVSGYDQSLALSVCAGETAEFNGAILQAGETRVFNLVSQGGCDSTITVSVTGAPALDFIASAAPSCDNEASGSVSVVFNGPAPAGAAYSLNGVDFQDTPVFESLEPGDYTVIVRDANGCTAGQNITIDGLEPLKITVEPQVLPCSQDPVMLIAELQSGGDSEVTYTWSNGADGPAIEVDEAGIYTLTAANDCETVTVDGVVGQEYSNDLRAIYVPNAFSPGGGTDNAVFRAYPGGQVQVNDFQLMVLDRWGNLLFRTEDLQNGWDGEAKGHMMPAAVYVWRLEAEIEVCGETRKLQKQGDLMLIR